MTTKARELKESKVKAVKAIKEKIDLSKLIILTDYRGMTVKQVTELKKKLRENNAEFRVCKNSYFVKALPKELASLEEYLKGSIATVFGNEELASPAKTLIDFIEENEKPKIIAGVIEKDICGEGKIKMLSKLPSKQVLLSLVVGGLKAPLYNVVSVLQGPIRKLVYALDAIKKNKS